MAPNLAYRKKGATSWKYSDNWEKTLNKRKDDTTIQRIIELALAIDPTDIRRAFETPVADGGDHHPLLLRLVTSSSYYKSAATTPEITRIANDLGPDGRDALANSFGEWIMTFQMNGYLWHLQEQGKIPVHGKFYLLMCALAVAVNRCDLLRIGVLEKRNADGHAIDPVSSAVPLAPVTDDDDGDDDEDAGSHSYLYMVIQGTDARQIAHKNGAHVDGHNVVDKVREKWKECLECPGLADRTAIFYGTRKEARKLELETPDDFKACRTVEGPARTLEQYLQHLAPPQWLGPTSMPTASIDDCINVSTASEIVTVRGRRIASWVYYVQIIETWVARHYGDSDCKLIRLFARMHEKAIRCGEAVVGVKPGHGIGDTVLCFPSGLKLTAAMRPPSRPAHIHHTRNSGESTASAWIFGDKWDCFYRMFQDTGGLTMSECRCFFSLVSSEHSLFSRTPRIKVPAARTVREFPIVSVERYSLHNFCLTNERQRTVSDAFGRGETRAQVIESLRVALVRLREEIVALPVYRDTDEVLSRLGELILGFTPAQDRNVAPRLTD